MDAGRLIEIAPRKEYDYSFLAGSSSSLVVLARAMDVVPDYRFKLITLIHDVKFAAASGATATIAVQTTMPSPYQDGLVSLDTPSITETIDLNTNQGDMLVSNATNVGPYANVVVLFNQIDAGERFFVDMSVYALLRAGG